MNKVEIKKLVIHQLRNIFMLSEEETVSLNENIISRAIDDTKFCLQAGNSKYYIVSEEGSRSEQENGDINPYNSVMYCIFLYWLSRRLFQNNRVGLADKVYYLNKMLNSVELFYEVELPTIWSCEHPLGSVMGRACYGDYFFFYQGCTVGGNIRKDGSIVYPVIGKNVKMFSNSKILGDCHIGNHTIISANSYVKDQNVPDNMIVYGQSPNLVFKENFFKS